MLKGFTTRELILIALVAAFAFILSIPIGTGLVAALGANTPLVSIFFGFILAYIFVLSSLIIRKFWGLTLTLVLFSVLCIPATNLGGPGIHKVFAYLICGLIIDIILYAGKYKGWAYYVGFGLGLMIILPLGFLFLTLLGLPGAEKLAPFLLLGSIAALISGLIAVWLARLTYNKKLKDSKLIKQISS